MQGLQLVCMALRPQKKETWQRNRNEKYNKKHETLRVIATLLHSLQNSNVKGQN